MARKYFETKCQVRTTETSAGFVRKKTPRYKIPNSATSQVTCENCLNHCHHKVIYKQINNINNR